MALVLVGSKGMGCFRGGVEARASLMSEMGNTAVSGTFAA
jgi:hypothetical protein